MSAAPPNFAVNLVNVTKRFGQQVAVNDLTLQVPVGSIYGFIGPNGSGKTTTIRMILHIVLPDGGTVEVLGQQGTRAANDAIGYLPEERGLYKKMTVRRLLVYYAGLKGMAAVEAGLAADEWLERMSLSAWAGKKLETLSKGMAQKVQFISSVISRPKLLILDEPFSGLDPVNLEVLRTAILGLKKQGTTVIFSTHNMSTAEEMCDYVFMIYRGNKVLDGTLASIRARFGSDTIRLRVQGGAEALRGIPGVEVSRDFGQHLELRNTGDPQGMLQAIAARARVELFEVTTPSLHDIFVRIAQPQAAEAAHA
jgi:ABC-2 type transport system ATP-binding protein